MSRKMRGESSQSNSNQQEYGNKAYASVVSFKRGEDHTAAGVLLTLKHALAVLIYIIYLDTESSFKDVIEVGAWFESPRAHYDIEKLSYNRKKFRKMYKRKQQRQFGIVTVSNSIRIEGSLYQHLSILHHLNRRFWCRLVLANYIEWHFIKIINSDFFVFSRFYWTPSETYRKSVNWTQLLVKFTEKSCCPNKYRTSCKFYWSFLCVYSVVKLLQMFW